jgi:hypothetical protein
MVAASMPMPQPLPLLLEPVEPPTKTSRWKGWHVTYVWAGRDLRRILTRDHTHDAMGAFVQHVIVRYVVHGVARQALAAETNMSQRQIQAYVGGVSYQPYGLAVIEALRELGIPNTKGERWDTRGGERLRQLIVAQQRTLLRALPLLVGDPRIEAARVARLIRLLEAGKEPVRCP